MRHGATDALYRVVHDGGTAEVSVNQRTGGGLWHYLGSYAFDPLNSPTVSLAANDNGSVAADAPRFVGGPGGAADIAYLHNDHLGTPQAMTDAAAQLLWWRDQTPFGQTVATSGFSMSPLRFPGQYADTESGLAYNYFRDYDPAQGRYVQSDPIGLKGGLNTYGYVMGNPLRYTDPTGELVFLAPAVVPIVAGAVVGAGTEAIISYVQYGCIDARRVLIAGILGGALGGIARAGILGLEVKIGNNFRIAPFGNRTGHPSGKWPHYHRRGAPSPDGKTPPGQGIGRHRPWERKSTDTSFWDRF